MSLSTFQQTFDPAFAAFLQERAAETKRDTEDAAVAAYVDDAVALARGGKRARPYLCAVAYAGAGGADEALIRRLGHALECFQLFCLLQDDVMDRAQTRHGLPALHRAVERRLRDAGADPAKAAHAAEGQAVLLGDLYFAWSVHAAFAASAPAGVAREYADMAATVIGGQMLDVDFTLRARVDTRGIEKKMRLKTAGYSFVSPLRIGLAAAGAPPETLDWSRAFGTEAGLGFQMQDDLRDVFRDEPGAVLLNDIREGQKTPLTQHVMEYGTDAQRASLAAMLGNPAFTDVAAARALFRDSGAEAACREATQRHYNAAEALLADAPLAPAATDDLRALLAWLRGRA